MLKKNDCNMNSTLEVFNIGKKYKNRPVLRNVSLNVRRGEAVGLLGPNGAGKTTCFYCVTGLITPDYGDVHIDGQDITNLPMYRRARMGIGYLPQEASIFRSLSVEDNIKAILEIVIDDESRREKHAGRAAVRIFNCSSAQIAGNCPVRRRTAPTGNCPGFGQPAKLHPARRTAGRY